MSTAKHLVTAAALAILIGAAARAGHPPASLSAIPEFINYQGRLVDPNGVPYSNANHVVQLRLYDSASGGAKLWGEQYTVKTQDGYFSILLGTGGTPVDGLTNKLWKVMWKSGASDPDNFYLALTVLTDSKGNPISGTEASPRQQFLTAPFAYRSHQSVYASKADALFDAPAGVSTPTLTSTQDISVTRGLRVTGGDLYATTLRANAGNDLEIVGATNRHVEICAPNSDLHLGYYTPGGSTLFSRNVYLGFQSGTNATETYLYGNNIRGYAAPGNKIELNCQTGTVNIGYTPGYMMRIGGGYIYIPPYGAEDVNIGYEERVSISATNLAIGTANIKIDGEPMFVYHTPSVPFSSQSNVDVDMGIDVAKYDVMIVGWHVSVNPQSAPRSIYVSGSRVVVIFPSAVTGNAYPRLLGIRKGLTKFL